MKKNILLNLLICTIILFSSSQALSQSTSFHGKVIDKNNGEPINNVNVYVANTSIGTTTDSQGYFELTNLPQGTFDIIFSHVSYYFNKKRLLIKQRYNDIGIIELCYKVHQLETVIVEAEETSLWNDRYEVFVEKFIGTSDNADSTFIIDPYKIDFWESDGKLYASTVDPIEIVNKSLGYNITYFLEYFESCSDYTKYSGNSVFTQISYGSIQDSIRWNKNRKQTYLGSLRHFLSELNRSYSKFLLFPDSINNKEYSNIDSVEIHRSFTGKRSYNIYYAYKINSLSSEADEHLNNNGFFIYRCFALPWESPRTIVDEPISMKDLLSEGEIKTERYLHFDKYLRIYFIPNYKKEDYTFNFSIKNVHGVQSSFIDLEQDSVMVDIQGRYCDKFGIHTYGTFGQERVSDMLPYEYQYITE